MKALAQIKAFLKDEEGASGIEYAMLAGMVAVVLAAASGTIGPSITAIFKKVSDALAISAK